MFKKLKQQIESLDTKRQYLAADWQEDEHPLLDFYVKIMPLALNAERCSIFIYDPDSTTIWLKAGTGLKERDIEVTGEFESVVGNVIASGKHVIKTGLDQKNGMHRHTDQTTGFITRDVLCIPIRSLDGKKVVGAVQLLNKKDGSKFNDADVSLLQEMAHYLELTIENIYFNQEVAGVLKGVSKSLMTLVTTMLWVVGLAVVAIIGRVVWVGMMH